MTQSALELVIAGAENIKATTALATADIPFAQARIDAAVALQASLTATKTAVAAWNPSATYKASDLVAVKGQLTWIIDQLSTLTTALNEQYTYRKANDQSVIDINNAILWIARQQYGSEGETLF